MALVVIGLSVSIVVVIIGVFVFQFLPRLFPKLKTLLPSQAVISNLQIVPISIIFPALLWLFFSVYLEAHVPGNPYSSLLGWWHIFFTLYMMANAVFNYYMTVFTCPGYPQSQDEYTRDRCFVKTYQMCVKCRRVRSAGTHHCSWCHTCVEMMCHHCPFTNNCIGRRNYVYYFTFLTYAFFGLLYACYLAYFPFVNCMSGLAVKKLKETLMSVPHLQLSAMHRYSSPDGSIFKEFDDVKMPESCEVLQEYAILFAPTVGITCFIAALFLFQTFLLLADMSIVDFYDSFSKATSFQELLRIWHVSLFKRRKFRFVHLVLGKKSQWWKFFVPCPTDVENDLPPKDL
ncbi:putative ZDHHC-type palmitoyltransferase 8 [Oculina patagonica]